MNTLDELIYYCNENITTGALMLNGEWGCGKTHLIETDLKEALKDTHFLARISLFGIDSIEGLNRAVRKEWLAACIPAVSALEKHEDTLKLGKNLVEHSLDIVGTFDPILKQFKEASKVSDNIYDLIPIQKRIKTRSGEREFILVFDDLERTKLNVVDVLGCINEYCENQGFKAIIIANEDKIIYSSTGASQVVIINKDSSTTTPPPLNLAYLEIKEKIVARTIRCKPDYQLILHAILYNDQMFDKEYSRFLQDNEQLICCIFDMTPEDSEYSNIYSGAPAANDSKNAPRRTRNLRSLKCALQDFHRVYRCLTADQMDNLGIYLYDFIIFMMAFRNGSISINSDEATIDEAVTQIYPMYNPRYMLQAEKNWILGGDWDEKNFGKEDELLKESERAVEPRDRLRLNRITDMDEDDILKGYTGLLEDCYAGRLTLNEYVIFIKNACDIRYYEIKMPCEIDWSRVMEGINIRFKSNIESQYAEGYVYQSIPEKTRKHYSEEELTAYDLISKFRTRNTAVYEGNRKVYLNELKNNGIRAFAICENRSFNCFDEEMANATADCYESANQASKNRFPIWFEGCWGDSITKPVMDSQKTAAGLNVLKARLEALYAEYQKQRQGVSAKHTANFMKTVDSMIGRLDVGKTDVEE